MQVCSESLDRLGGDLGLSAGLVAESRSAPDQWSRVCAAAAECEIGPWAHPASSPGAARLDIDRRVFRALRDVEARVQAKPPRNQITKSRAAGGHDAGLRESNS